MKMTNVSAISTLQAEALQYMPAGVSAGGRYNPSLGYALYLKCADGSRIYDVDGKEYIDFNLSHGACFLGHNHPAIKQAIKDALEIGILSGYETEHTVKLAKKIVEIIPCAEMVRLANGGSEAIETTLRLARTFTRKKKILKFWGHFHGTPEYLGYSSHSPRYPVIPGSRVPVIQECAGVPTEIDELVLVIPWKDEEALERIIKEEGNEIAAIIMEPISYNQGCIVASKSYMQYVRNIATNNNIVLIYDEVLSAFRTGPGCAQEYYGVTPDLCIIAKALANGAPISVITGRSEIMQLVMPFGNVIHSGTYTGNLICVMAALASLNEITKSGFYDRIYNISDKLYQGLSDIFARAGILARVQGLGARFGIFFGFTEEVKDFTDTFKHDTDMARKFIQACANNGVYFHSYGKICTGHHGISASHTIRDIDEALNRIETAVENIKKDRT